MPRPFKEDPRDRFRTFRFTEGELARLEARARSSGCNLSSYVRIAVLTAQFATEPERPPGRKPANGSPAAWTTRNRSSAGVRRLAEEMRRVGVNLNQIARRMNEQRIPPPRELTLLIDEIRIMVREAREP